MRIWFDTEFIDDGRRIELISIGAVRADGAEYYAENGECELGLANPWVNERVLPKLQGGAALRSRREIAADLRLFAGAKPEFWGYYGAYDWVCLCQLFGPMVDLPAGWPKYVLDLKQLSLMAGDILLPAMGKDEHHALVDARWTKTAWEFLLRHPTASMILPVYKS